MYPLKFKSRLKERPWGGHRLAEAGGSFSGRVDASKRYGESWDLSGLRGDVSAVAGGGLKGNSLNELVEVYMGDFVGEQVFDRYGEEFPLSVKRLDCADSSSVQVHPCDETAADRHNAYGKDEFLYVTDCRQGARIYIGFNRRVEREEFLEYLSQGRLDEILQGVEVHRGDMFFIAAGTVHALGAGVEAVDIQQSSDVAYRIFDWNRTDADGRSLPLHTALAIDAIDFDSTAEDAAVKCEPRANEAVEAVHSEHFIVSLLDVEGETEQDLADKDSFVIYTCVEGEAAVESDGCECRISTGETVLIAAENTSVTFSGKARLLAAAAHIHEHGDEDEHKHEHDCECGHCH